MVKNKFLTVLCLAIINFSLTFANTRPSCNNGEELYLELIKRAVFNCIYKDIPQINYWERPSIEQMIAYSPAFEQSMIGFNAMDFIHVAMKDVVENGVEGDFIETGVWRGGATIFMRAFLKVRNISDRKVWVADSFAGLPHPNTDKYPLDQGLDLTSFEWLTATIATVKKNFERYDLLDDQVVFLKGWFSETLPKANIEKIAIMRLDGDLYESTMDALTSLYHKLEVGGYCIIDDYGAVSSCAQAVTDFRMAHGITDPIYPIDWTGVYWKKS